MLGQGITSFASWEPVRIRDENGLFRCISGVLKEHDNWAIRINFLSAALSCLSYVGKSDNYFRRILDLVKNHNAKNSANTPSSALDLYQWAEASDQENRNKRPYLSLNVDMETVRRRRSFVVNFNASPDIGSIRLNRRELGFTGIATSWDHIGSAQEFLGHAEAVQEIQGWFGCEGDKLKGRQNPDFPGQTLYGPSKLHERGDVRVYWQWLTGGLPLSHNHSGVKLTFLINPVGGVTRDSHVIESVQGRNKDVLSLLTHVSRYAGDKVSKTMPAHVAKKVYIVDAGDKTDCDITDAHHLSESWLPREDTKPDRSYKPSADVGEPTLPSLMIKADGDKFNL